MPGPMTTEHRSASLGIEAVTVFRTHRRLTLTRFWAHQVHFRQGPKKPPGIGVPVHRAAQAAPESVVACSCGLVPLGQRWPARAESESWECGSLRYLLRRRRPKGLKGPHCLWVTGDNWVLQTNLARPRHPATVEIDRKVRELRAAIYQWSVDGLEASSREFKRWRQARHDDAFQSFKARTLPPCRGSRAT